ncbi:hypothetical protein [Plantactinospora sonchi]|uniref:MmpS family membrane protein n=1 Tax=Plantactinospora sonchi TaxID=1544735 RepID=A0ABU7RM14_9ACTN
MTEQSGGGSGPGGEVTPPGGEPRQDGGTPQGGVTSPGGGQTSVRRTRRRLALVAGIAAIVALVIGLGLTVFGNDREIRMEVTSEAGAVAGISWRGPDDSADSDDSVDPGDDTGRDGGSGAAGDLGDPYDQGGIRTPWSETVELSTRTGALVLDARALPGHPVTCRLIVGDQVVAEQTGTVGVTCTVTVEHAFPDA